MFDLKLHVEFRDHGVVEIGTIVYDNPLEIAIPTDKVMPSEPGHDVLGNREERGYFKPLCEVINGDEDETMFFRSNRLNLSNHINVPHYKRPRSSQDIQRYWRHMYLVSIDLALVISS